MHITYSTGARFAGGGIGDTAYHAVRGLHRHQLLYRLLCGSYRSTEIPDSLIISWGAISRLWRKIAIYDNYHLIDHYYRVFYDHWAARKMPQCNILQAFSGFSLRTMHRAKKMDATIVLDRELAHPLYLNKLLQEEHEQRGWTYHWPPTAQRIHREIQEADYVLVPSDFVYETFQIEGEQLNKVIRIPYGVDITQFRPPNQKRRADPFRVLFVGQVSIRKGIHYLLEAWRQLKWKNAELWIAGQGMLPPDVDAQYRKMAGVKFLGFVSDPVQTYQEANVFAFPSLGEGSALVIYEAMACALPIITTFNAGSIVRDGESGYVLPIRDVDALANQLENLRTNDHLRQEMGRVARAHVENYTWDHYGDRLAEVLRKLRE